MTVVGLILLMILPLRARGSASCAEAFLTGRALESNFQSTKEKYLAVMQAPTFRSQEERAQVRLHLLRAAQAVFKSQGGDSRIEDGFYLVLLNKPGGNSTLAATVPKIKSRFGYELVYSPDVLLNSHALGMESSKEKRIYVSENSILTGRVDRVVQHEIRHMYQSWLSEQAQREQAGASLLMGIVQRLTPNNVLGVEGYSDWFRMDEMMSWLTTLIDSNATYRRAEMQKSRNLIKIEKLNYQFAQTEGEWRNLASQIEAAQNKLAELLREKNKYEANRQEILQRTRSFWGSIKTAIGRDESAALEAALAQQAAVDQELESNQYSLETAGAKSTELSLEIVSLREKLTDLQDEQSQYDASTSNEAFEELVNTNRPALARIAAMAKIIKIFASAADPSNFNTHKQNVYVDRSKKRGEMVNLYSHVHDASIFIYPLKRENSLWVQIKLRNFFPERIYDGPRRGLPIEVVMGFPIYDKASVEGFAIEDARWTESEWDKSYAGNITADFRSRDNRLIESPGFRPALAMARNALMVYGDTSNEILAIIKRVNESVATGDAKEYFAQIRQLRSALLPIFYPSFK